MHVLLTGHTGGLGQCLAPRLLSFGCTLSLISRTPSSRPNPFPSSTFVAEADLSIPSLCHSAIEKAASHNGPLSAVICTVGSGTSASPGTETYADWLDSLHLNLFTATNVVESLRSLNLLQDISIVLVSSICGQQVIPQAPITYSCSKAALDMYVRTASLPLALSNCRINSVAPGNLLHDRSVWQRISDSAPDKLVTALSNVSLQRLVTPDEVASLIQYLISPEASAITGCIFPVDCGQLR